MKILIRTLSIALVFSLPLTAICLGANLVTRMPDVYQYEFKATDALKSFDLDKDNDEMGKFISDFMLGKEKEFQLVTHDDDRPLKMFGENEISAVVNARNFMNIVAVLGAAALIITIAAFIMLKKHEMDRELRRGVKICVVVYIVMIIAYLMGVYIALKTGHTLEGMLGYVPDENDLLPKLITEGLKKKICFSVVGISTVIMAIITYIAHRITEPKRIFSRNY